MSLRMARFTGTWSRLRPAKMNCGRRDACPTAYRPDIKPIAEGVVEVGHRVNFTPRFVARILQAAERHQAVLQDRRSRPAGRRLAAGRRCRR